MRIRKDVVVSKNKSSKTKPWIVRWWGKYDVNKEKQPRLSKSFKTKKEAERFAQSLKNDIQDGISIEPKKITLQQLCDKYLKAYKPTLRYSSYRAYISTTDRLKEYFSPYCRINSIRKEDAIIFINSLMNQITDEEASDSTRSRHLRQCKRIFNIAQEWGYTRKNPFKGIKLGKLKKKDWHSITTEEFANILNAVENHAESLKINIDVDKIRLLRLKVFYSVMYYCGLRFGEAANLLWDNGDIDFENNQINIANRFPQKDIPIFNVKDYETRSIPVPRKVMKLLRELKQKSRQDSPFVFHSADGYERLLKRWHTYCQNKGEDWNSKNVITNARRNFKQFCKKAGIKTNKVLTLQSLRKGYGTNMARLGVPANTLKDLMGHSSITTTMEFYIKTLDENKISAAEKLNDLAVM